MFRARMRLPTRAAAHKKRPLLQGAFAGTVTLRRDQTDGVIEQVALSALQVVAEEPGVFGVKLMVADEVIWAEVIAVVGAVHALACGARIDICDWPAATAEFM